MVHFKYNRRVKYALEILPYIYIDHYCKQASLGKTWLTDVLAIAGKCQSNTQKDCPLPYGLLGHSWGGVVLYPTGDCKAKFFFIIIVLV